MSLGAQLKRIASGAAAFRADLFGHDAEGKRQQFLYDNALRCTGYFGALNLNLVPEGLNLRETVDCIVRITKASLPVTPQEGKRIRIYGGKPDGTDLTVSVDQLLGTHPINPEWVLGCHGLNNG